MTTHSGIDSHRPNESLWPLRGWLNPVTIFVGGMAVMGASAAVVHATTDPISREGARLSSATPLSRFDFDYAGGYVTNDGLHGNTHGQSCLERTPFDPDFFVGPFSESPGPSNGNYDLETDTLTIQPSNGVRALKLSGMKTVKIPLQPKDKYTQDTLGFYGCSLQQ